MFTLARPVPGLRAEHLALGAAAAHTTAAHVPLAAVAVARNPSASGVGRAAQMGLDRALSYGFKRSDGLQHTRPGLLARSNA